MNKFFNQASAWLAVFLVLGGCSPKVLDFAQAEVAAGKIYARESNDGFSGKVTNISVMAFINQQEGVEPLLRATLNATTPGRDKGAPGGLLSRIPCEVGVEDGVLDGAVLCTDPRTKVKLLETAFKDGLLEGSFTLYSQTPGNEIQTTANFSKGKASGTHEVFSEFTHKLILRGNWTDGMRDGKEEGFHPESGNLISSLTWKNGKREGELVRLAPDGQRVIHKATYVDDRKEGLEESFDPESGFQTAHIEYSKDSWHGVVKKWTSFGFVDQDEVYENGRSIQRNWDSTFNVYINGERHCPTEWLKAFRREQGSRPDITLDQANDWHELCRQGKSPEVAVRE